jgi:hypothetical protein
MTSGSVNKVMDITNDAIYRVALKAASGVDTPWVGAILQMSQFQDALTNNAT